MTFRCRLRIPSPKCLEVICNWIFLQILEYFHIYNEISRGRDPRQNMKFIYLIHSLSAQLGGNFAQYFQYAYVLTVTCHINSGMEFSTYGMMSVFKRSFGVWSILDFWIRYIQLVLETTTSMGMLALQPPIVSHPTASTIPTVTASTAMAPGDLSPSGRCPSASGIHGTGNEQSSH